MPVNSIKVMIVDDVAAVRHYLTEILHQAGITAVVEAADGKTAQQLFALHQPQLVFLDIQLPDMNGQQLLKQFKQQQRNTEVVMVSAFSSVENLQQAVANGARAFVMKPFTSQRICKVIDPLLH